MSGHDQMTPGDAEYERLAREEIEHYSEIFLGAMAPQAARETLLQPVPPSWIEAETRASAMVREKTGYDLSGHVLRELRQPHVVKMLSLGCGPGGIELAFARQAPDAKIRCVDLNPVLIQLGQERAKSEGLKIQFEVGDLNLLDLPMEEYDLVFCHASLHHVLELEFVAEQIRKTLRPGGHLITVDVCSRNGYLMWPETREIAGNLFRTLPARFRINHTAYGKLLLDEDIWEMDTSNVSMECIRAQDITSILSKVFHVEAFVPYFSLCRRLIDTMYGPNYNLDEKLDKALLDWIWELDRFYLDSKRLRPETFFAIYGKR